MRRNQLLSIALVTMMALTVVSGVGVIKANADTWVDNPTQDQLATALESGSLEWTYYVNAPSNEQFASYVGVLTETGINPNPFFKDRDGVVLRVMVDPTWTTYTPGANVAALETTVVGPGTIGWWWDFDTPLSQGSSSSFQVDGVTKLETPVSYYWAPWAYTVPDGQHKLRWEVSIQPTLTYTQDVFCNGALNSVTWMPSASLNQGAVAQAIKDFRQDLQPTDFTSKQAYNTYVNKLTAVVHMVEAGNYNGAKQKIINDLMKQTDDTTLNGALGTIAVYLTALQAAR